MSTRRHVALFGAIAALTGGALAGPLNPPPGPPAPTPKLEARTPITPATTPAGVDSVFQITQPGSYYLVGNVTGVAGRHGIHVNVAEFGAVTIDLNGFTLRGVPGALDGVRVSSGIVSVSNGTVADWSLRGLLQVAEANRVVALNNTGGGIYTAGPARVSRCIAIGNGSNGNHGIFAVDNAIVSDCIVADNGTGPSGGAGIQIFRSSRVERCTVFGNGTGATSGFAAWGIRAENNCSIVNCRVDGNGSAGITTGGGILASNGSLVTDCTLQGNVGSGIVCGGPAFIARNVVGGTISGTSPTGIFVNGQGARIEDNYVFGNTIGIRTLANAHTLIFGNCATASLSTPYDIPVGNDFGPVGTGAGATSPWSNIAN